MWSILDELRHNWLENQPCDAELLARMFHELQSRDRETGNPLAGLSGAERARRRWVCPPASPERAGDS